MPNRELTIPSYYLTRYTPDGPRYLYPIQAIAEAAGERWERPWPDTGPHGRRGWTFEVTEPADVAWRFADPWLVADAPIRTVRRTRPGPPQDDGLIKRDQPHAGYDEPVSPDLRAAFDDMPARPDDAETLHYREHAAGHVCWRCRVFAATYEPHRVPGPDVVETQSFDGWQELPGGDDPDADREWLVDDPGHLTLFGRHTGHLWPGRLTGLRAAIIEALRAHPLVAEVNVWAHKQHQVSVLLRVPFEPRRTETKQVPETRRSRTRTRPVTREVWGIERRIPDATVPDALTGATKADAIAAWDRVVAREVSRFVPYGPHAAVCGTCDGLGVVTGDA